MAKRRANGEGSIRKRKDGRWEGRYTAGFDQDGRRIIRNVLGKSQAEAKEKLKAAIQEAEVLDFTRQEYTVGEWLLVWLTVYAKPTVRESTLLYYQNFINNHIIPQIGRIPLKKLKPVDVQKLYNQLLSNGRIKRFPNSKGGGLSSRTVRGIHMMLHEALEQAVTERLISRNPTEGCKIPPRERREMKVLPPENIGAYLKAAGEWGVLPMFYLELTSGLRRGELLALLWTDVDTKNCTVSVSKSVARLHGELVVTQPKTLNSVRTITVPRRTIELLEQEHSHHPDSPYLFPSPVTGGMRDPDATRRIHDKLLKQAGLEHIRFHDLRHTFATLALQNGVDVKTLSGMMGHYSDGFTLDTYTHLTDKMQQDAAEKMGNFMAQAAG